MILGIETSCDETAAAIVNEKMNIEASIVFSQVDLHRRYGGVVPEIASRNHLEKINIVIDEAFNTSGLKWSSINGVAVTYGPGLIGALMVGISAAKSIALAKNIDLIGVNHLEGHFFAPLLVGLKPKFPFLALVVSGGHTSLIKVNEISQYEVVGQTLDDAAGEALDKIAKFLDLGYPGGPIIEKLAREGDEQAIDFPQGLRFSGDFNFSFSGLKTALIYFIRDNPEWQREFSINDLCASFQKAIIDILVEKTFSAAEKLNLKEIILAGGVTANLGLRKTFEERARSSNLKIFIPPVELCTDNAAMIAGAGFLKWKKGFKKDLYLEATPSKDFKN